MYSPRTTAALSSDLIEKEIFCCRSLEQSFRFLIGKHKQYRHNNRQWSKQIPTNTNCYFWQTKSTLQLHLQLKQIQNVSERIKEEMAICTAMVARRRRGGDGAHASQRKRVIGKKCSESMEYGIQYFCSRQFCGIVFARRNVRAVCVFFGNRFHALLLWTANNTYLFIANLCVANKREKQNISFVER